jgi:hypothetical protein
MQYLFLTFMLLAVVVFAPLRVTLSLLATTAIISLVVKLTATKVMGPVSITDAARSVAWAFALLAIAVVGSLWVSQGQLHVEGVAAVALLCGLFAAFVLGFTIALQASFGGSAIIATVSTAISALILFVLQPVLF